MRAKKLWLSSFKRGSKSARSSAFASGGTRRKTLSANDGSVTRENDGDPCMSEAKYLFSAIACTEY